MADFTPELIEKATDAVPLYLMTNGRDTQRRVAEAVVAAVADDLIAKGERYMKEQRNDAEESRDRYLDQLVKAEQERDRLREAERKYADLVVEILSLATKWKEEILSDDLDFDLYAVPEILQSLVNGENRD